MQWQSVNDDFQAPPICCSDPKKIQFPDQNVGRNTTACFTAYSCHHAFQSVTPFAQNPCPCARCAVMANRVEETATPAGTHGWVKVHLQATGGGREGEDNSKQVRVEFGQTTNRANKSATPTQRQGTSPQLLFNT